MSDETLAVELICTDLPGLRFEEPGPADKPLREPVYLGIQRAKEVIELAPADRRQVIFQPTFRIAQRKDGGPNFLGPFAQGTPAARFLYLSWGERQPDGSFEMFRRAKVMLAPITWQAIERSRCTGRAISASLRLTDRRGGPLCATVAPERITWHL